MTANETLQKAIDIARANGWNSDYDKNEVLDRYDFPSLSTLIYNHDFAKALWGDSVIESFGLYKLYNGSPKWKMHLMEMVVAPDPIKYLEENIGVENGNSKS